MGQYYYHEQDGTLFLRLRGKLKYTSSLGFERFLDSRLGGELDSVLVDLRDAEYIDSTNLGLIARIAETLDKARKPLLTIISTREDINEVLSSLGFEQRCRIIRSFEEDPPLSDIPAKSGTQQDFLALMVDAHKKLIALHRNNEEVFRDVLDLMEKELD